MKHIHHILPKHMGGTDDESNLVELMKNMQKRIRNYTKSMGTGKII